MSRVERDRRYREAHRAQRQAYDRVYRVQKRTRRRLNDRVYYWKNKAAYLARRLEEMLDGR